MTDSIEFLELSQLQANPLQPRGVINTESLQDLVDSIKKHGILEPLVVAKTPAGLQIIAGERRWRAAQIAGLTQVPALIKETTPQGMLEMALVENVQRSDLNPIDRAKAFQRLMSEFGLNTSDISDRISKSSSYVSNSIRLLSLPDALKDGLLSNMISEGHARALASIQNTQLMIEAYKQVLKENASVRRAEELSRRYRAQIGQKPKKIKKEPLIVSEEIDVMQHNLLNKLGGKRHNRVKLTRSQAETKITIVLKGNVDKTENRLHMIYSAIQNMDEVQDTTQDSQDPSQLTPL